MFTMICRELYTVNYEWLLFIDSIIYFTKLSIDQSGGCCMGRESVILKGSKSGIVVILDNQKAFTDIIDNIKQKFMESSRFFLGTNLKIGFTGRNLNEPEKQQLADIITGIIGNDVNISFESDDKREVQSGEFFNDIEEGIAKFHKGTVRSGQRLIAEGNLVIIGDVNPGAEVIAGGNIVVMGSLRGIVHAGYKGNTKAIVAALNLHPTQLRIAGIITRSPDDEMYKHEIIPEVAYIKENCIYIDSYLPKKPYNDN